MRFDDSYRQKIDQMHLDDAFIGNLADQMTEAATNREHIEVMEMDPGQPIQHRRKWISAAGTVAAVPSNLMGSGRTLALHMYVLSSEGLHMNQASATAVVIMIFVLAINGLSGMIAKRIAKG